MSYMRLRTDSCPLAIPAFALFLAFISVNQTAAAQATDPPPKPSKFTPGIDVSIGVEGDLTAARMPTFTTPYSSPGTGFTQVTQSAAPSA